jgi:hypothetical protein
MKIGNGCCIFFGNFLVWTKNATLKWKMQMGDAHFTLLQQKPKKGFPPSSIANAACCSC